MKHSFDTILEKLLRPDRLPFRQNKQEAWSRIEARLAEARVLPMESRGSRWSKQWAVAAGFALLIAAGLGLLAVNNQVQYSNDTAVAMEVQLPDGSVAWLNEDASITYSRFMYVLRRNVHMHGEVFYQVQKGKPFTVHTEQGSVEVLGTSFNVQSNANTMHVSVRSGKVKVRNTSGEDVILLPGNAVLVEASGLEQQSMPLASIGAWRAYVYEFVDEEVDKVFERLSMDTGYSIDVEHKLSMRYTGKFAQSEKIEDMMAIICMPLGLQYTIDHERRLITILKK